VVARIAEGGLNHEATKGTKQFSDALASVGESTSERIAFQFSFRTLRQPKEARQAGNHFVLFVASWFKPFSRRAIPKPRPVSTQPAPPGT
jgi:hypothetical protein